MLDEILDRLKGLDPAELKEIVKVADQATQGMAFVPQPGPQTEAYFSEADILLFGGSPGGGKTALEVGLALNEHRRSLIVRREFVDLDGVLHTLKNILKNPNPAGLVGGTRPEYRKPDGGIIHFQGMGKAGNLDLGSKQGNPHDLICVDEAAQLPEDQVRMLLGWLRTDIPGQRCRVVLGSNPPLNAIGDWLIPFFGPWLDPNHPNPAAPGELRWYLPTIDGRGEREAQEGEYVIIDDVRVFATSRTFIPSKFTDNKYYDEEQYAKTLAGLPPQVRERMSSGNFLLARPDDEMQCIPTGWVQAAQARWTPYKPANTPMCAIGVDIAQGGSDNMVLASRYDGWYKELEIIPGVEVPGGAEAAGLVVKHRRDNAVPVIDIGGGWGGDCYAHLRENNIPAVSYMGIKQSNRRTRDNLLKFTNVRTEAYWKFREALDPEQDGGSIIRLPPDPLLLAELVTPQYEVTGQGIKLESKDKVKEKLGRSPDRADAVVMAWWQGINQSNVQGGFTGKRQRPQVVLGRSSAQRRRR